MVASVMAAIRQGRWQEASRRAGGAPGRRRGVRAASPEGGPASNSIAGGLPVGLGVHRREPGARVVAVDQSEKRLARLRENLARTGLAVEAVCADVAEWRPETPASRVLLDAPCTASGIVRRHPDVRWLRRPEDSAQLAHIQARLLKVLWPLLKPGGRLLYCTCSVFKAEGDAVVDSFLQRNTDARFCPSPRHLLPGAAHAGLPVGDNALGEHDGFYYALLEKSPTVA